MASGLPIHKRRARVPRSSPKTVVFILLTTAGIALLQIMPFTGDYYLSLLKDEISGSVWVTRKTESNLMNATNEFRRDDSKIRRSHTGTAPQNIHRRPPETTTKHGENVSLLIRPSSHSQASKPFPWDRDNICQVVENICHSPIRKNKWFYFFDDETSGPNSKQPSFSMPKRPIINILPGASREKSSQLEEQLCTISKVLNHVVVHGNHNHMLGEYYQRSLLQMHHLMEDYISYTNSTINKENEIQFYIHFSVDPSRKILDSHILYTMGLPFGNNVQSWVNVTETLPSCQCYRRLVFCGYREEHPKTNAVPSENDTQLTLTLIPDYSVRDNFTKYCYAGYLQKIHELETDGCDTWQDLRTSLIKTYENIYPHLNNDVAAYRKYILHRALQRVSPGASATTSNEKLIHQEWTIIGLSQRSDRRKWLNINDTLSHCNDRYHTQRVVCVEVDVANLPTNFSNTSTNQSLTSVEEQLVLYRSIDALIGIHGSQLTQGVLMRSNSVVVELFPWIPDRKHWGVMVWGDGWVNQKNHPTPMGIMWHNTDINEAGYYLTRESVPLCLNQSDHVMHNFTLDRKLPSYYHMKNGANITELEYCLQVLHENQFKWDGRDFNVGIDMINNFVRTFYFPYMEHGNFTKSNDDFMCNKWRQRGERNGFVLYNLWCRDDDGRLSAHHYYHHP